MLPNLAIAALVSMAATLPLTSAAPTRHSSLSASAILSIDPTTSTCASAPFPAECRTAVEAAPFISISFQNYGIISFNSQAAVLALILYETGGFKYSRNHYPEPGRPGQGTRNMQIPEWNLKYAQYLATQCTNCGIGTEKVRQAEAKGVDAVLESVNTDQWGFGSAAWFLVTQCEARICEGLESGSEAGWEAYLTECVGTTVTEDRTAVWSKAVAMGTW